MDMSRHCLMLVDTDRYRLNMVVSKTMRPGLAVTKRNSGGRANDAQRIQDNQQTCCSLPLSIGQKSSHLFCYAGAARTYRTNIIWPNSNGAATHDDSFRITPQTTTLKVTAVAGL